MTYIADPRVDAYIGALQQRTTSTCFYDGAIVPDPEGIITVGHENQTARTVAVRQGETIKAPALLAMFKHIIEDSRAGGWRTLKRS